MQFLPLLGKHLKGDDVIEVLEAFDMKVTYDFDRLNEGQPDAFWAESKPDGFQLRFDASQTLDTIFLHVAPSDSFAAISPSRCEVPLFSNVIEAKAYGGSEHLKVATGSSDFLGVHRDWVRIESAEHSTHYEFHEGTLAMITVSRNDF